MPYVITTTTPGPADISRNVHDPLYDGRPDVTRHAVATLGDSQLYAMRAVQALMDSGAYDGSGDYMQQAATHPESGGTIGPLPDGTMLKVRRVTDGWLAAHFSTGAERVRAIDIGLIPAYNARAAS